MGTTTTRKVAKHPASYVRLSTLAEDRGGAGTPLDRQEEDNARTAERLGWGIPTLYVDDDRSAYSGRKRPEYERLMRDIAEGRVDGVVTYHTDRLTRRPREIEDFLDAVDATGVLLAAATGEKDLSTPEGQAMLRQEGVWAKLESDTKARRIRRAHLRIAQSGRPSGGPRPFGFKADQVTHEPEEVRMLRDAAARVLKGGKDSHLHTITEQWNADGVVTATGGKWRSTSLRKILISPRIAGMRQATDEDGETAYFTAVWEPILDRPTWEAVRRVLLDPARRKGGPRFSYLLTGGLMVCGKPTGGVTATGEPTLCGVPLVGGPNGDGKASYRCAKGPGHLGCGGVAVLREPIEGLLGLAIIKRLQGEGLAQAVSGAIRARSDDTSLLTAMEQDEQALAEIHRERYVTRTLDHGSYLMVKKDLEAALEVKRRALSAERYAGVLAELTSPATVAQRWARESVEWRRALVRALTESIILHPAKVKPPRFDEDRVEVRWRY